MMTLSDLKRQYRKLYVDILEKEQDRGYTTQKEVYKLNNLRRMINEGRSKKMKYTFTELKIIEDLLREKIENNDLKDSHPLNEKYNKMIKKTEGQLNEISSND